MSKKKLFNVEIPIRCSPAILFEFLSTASGLQEWFADKVDSKDKDFFFTWNGATDEAEQIESIENESVKYRWDYYDDDEYFEFKILKIDITNETILQINDFADEFEIKDLKHLWETQVNNLKHRIGS